MLYTQTDLQTKEMVYTTFNQIMASLKKVNRSIEPEQVLADLKSGKKLSNDLWSYRWQVIELDDYHPQVMVHYSKNDSSIHYFEDIFSAIEFRDEQIELGYDDTDIFIPELYKNAHLNMQPKFTQDYEG
jgi:hypothetical protein